MAMVSFVCLFLFFLAVAFSSASAPFDLTGSDDQIFPGNPIADFLPLPIVNYKNNKNFAAFQPTEARRFNVSAVEGGVLSLKCEKSSIEIIFATGNARKLFGCERLEAATIITIRALSRQINIDCLPRPTTLPASDGLFEIRRVLTSPAELPVVGNSLVLQARDPLISDLYKAGAIKFTQSIASIESEWLTTARERRAVMAALENQPNEAVAGIMSSLSSDDSADPIAAALDGAIAAIGGSVDERAGEFELNSLIDIDTSYKTDYYGFNHDKTGRRAAKPFIEFYLPIARPPVRVNLTNTFFAFSAAVTIDFEWGLFSSSDNHFLMKVSGDYHYSYEIGISSVVPSTALSFWKELYQYQTPVWERIANLFTFNVGLNFTFGFYAAIFPPLGIDFVMRKSGSKTIEFGVEKNAKFPGGRHLDTIVADKKPVPATKNAPVKPLMNAMASLLPFSGNLGFSFSVRVKIKEVVALELSTALAIRVVTVPAKLGEKRACKPSITLPSPIANNPVTGTLLIEPDFVLINRILIFPMSISIGRFKWEPWAIQPVYYPPIVLAQIPRLCIAIRMKTLDFFTSLKVGGSSKDVKDAANRVKAVVNKIGESRNEEKSRKESEFELNTARVAEEDDDENEFSENPLAAMMEDQMKAVQIHQNQILENYQNPIKRFTPAYRKEEKTHRNTRTEEERENILVQIEIDY